MEYTLYALAFIAVIQGLMIRALFKRTVDLMAMMLDMSKAMKLMALSLNNITTKHNHLVVKVAEHANKQ